jgi:kynurenine 3-monooxygenase
MVHTHDGDAQLQMYGVRPNEVIYSVSRAALNRTLIEAAAEYPNVSLRFNQTCIGLDAGTFAPRFRDAFLCGTYSAAPLPTIATDGAGSPVRHALVAAGIAKVREEPLDHDYKELTIPARDGKPVLEVNALHIWPRGGFMLIALPNTDATFTATLFLAKRGPNSFEQLQTSASVEEFFMREFPSARMLMPHLTREFFEHPQGQLGTVYTQGWHAGGQALLLGDAAHAIVPFHGQGMNCAFEDCVEFDELVSRSSSWDSAFAEFERTRKPNTDAIAEMAIENYIEMRSTVLDPAYLRRKANEEDKMRTDPNFISRYAKVMFHPEIPFTEILRGDSYAIHSKI